MMRGDFVTIVMQGDFGKPRPALVIQADQFGEHATVTVLPMTSTLVAAPLLRTPIQPSAENGLNKPSQVMIDKAMTVKRDKLGQAFGRIDGVVMTEVERCLAVFLGIAK
ncbi:type II toxin-antitoxin system PemK/MazF family toxin [Ferrovum myxofaciens]|jgi:mRNA interferase MazF|uniref:Type II toxin-antitoxin system PemK/MazF family toxin n=2 Tax=root TaxID=1 RepID=A0A9E6MY87_9PROT|nr:type II toxin-antitoxin system PemK/MazF family toxin [Ferrovum myxofaciens]MBU6994179.1 type II toxin-antitoxin system PemK/MazF family toxin [Ferrovum myxofaciens]QKE39721.2 MAG: type II toxin-antitoxin system PemK/MazF family toxin [Ferrovum myxofaciens]QWY75837.1 MAG: type II toxin-antitoxin system PemK/MazF family toxin [Ferrovum myxofaciens]QWY78568.1 MAG: type II toxin-antitoxin system PemK/MazF family toxin [Ferrovum myxofaciens]